MSSYRINVRFDLDDEAECSAAEYLQNLYCKERKSRNRFIVESVLAHIQRITEGDMQTLLQSIRDIFREEIQDIAIVSSSQQKPVDDMRLTEEEQQENAQSVLTDLEMFG